MNCQDMLLSQVEEVYHQAEQILETKYGICHVTIQAECLRGQDEELFDNPTGPSKHLQIICASYNV